MKKTRLFSLFLSILVCVGILFSLASCSDEIYTKTDTDALIAELKAEINAKAAKNEEAIAALKNEYNAKIAELEKENAENKTAITELTNSYNAKVKELENSDKANADALAEHKAEYKQAVSTINTKIESNTAKIDQYKTDLQTNIDNLNANHNRDMATLNSLIAQLQSVDTENKAKISALEERVKNLLATFTVQFDTNGGGESIPTQSIKRGEKVKMPDEPTREGYKFLGWYVGDEKWSFIGYSVTENITLKAKWASTKILAVESNCELSGNNLTVLVKAPREYLDIKTKITYDENCSIKLFKDADLSEEYSFARMTEIKVGENKAYLLIKYDESEYTIYEIALYGIDTVNFVSEGNIFWSVTINENLTVNAPSVAPESQRNGYEFSHWTVDGEKVNFPYSIDLNTVFEAAYKPITYTITYSVNEGIMPGKYPAAYTVESGATLPIPTRSLYLFDGWYENSDFSGERITNFAIGEYGNKTLYAKWKSATNGIKFSLSNDGSYYTVTGYEGTSTEIVIPNTLDGKPVAEIADSAFKGKQRITSISIPDSVTSIGTSAFDGCISLKTLTLGSGITQIPSSMASGCSKLENITIPDSVTSIGSSAFRYCTSLTSVTIGNSVTSIGYASFRNCTSLTSITIPDSVTTIGGSAFEGCYSLTSITIPDSVTTIGYSAFHNCTSLTSITIPNSVTTIGNNAFYYCTSLTSVTIGNSVTTIGDSAFYHCTSLTRITIGDSVTSIGSYAFYNCDSLFVVYNNSDLLFEIGSESNGRVALYAKILVDNGETTYANDGYEYILTEDGFLFDYDGTTYRLRAYCGSELAVTLPDSVNGEKYEIYYMRGVVNVIIPDSVTSIGDRAFYNCDSLTSVTIGNSVTSIGSNAFYSCTSLTSVTIGDSVTTIGSSAFEGCTSLTSITIPFVGATKDGTSNTHFGYIFGASSYSYNDDYVPSSLKTVVITGGGSIGSYAFLDCTSLTSITIPDSVTEIGYASFSDCTSLTSITIPDSVTEIGGSTFSGCTSLTSITIPDSVTTIDEQAFYRCTSLTSITIPDSVTTIGEYAFCSCDSLTSITIPDSVTTIGSDAFCSCDSLTSITVGKNNSAYKDIDGNLYSKDGTTLIQYAIGKKDTSFIIPDSVTTIGYNAFHNCTSLTSVTIGDSVTTIGYSAFRNCTSLTSITVGENNTAYKDIDGNLYSKDGTTLIQYAIGKKDTSFIIPDSVTTIGEYAFEYCTSLTSVTIGNSVTTIGSSAFEDCYSLTSITIPDSVTSIGYSAFYNCTSLTSIKYRGTEAEWKAISKGSSWNYGTGSYTIIYNYTEEQK